MDALKRVLRKLFKKNPKPIQAKPSTMATPTSHASSPAQVERNRPRQQQSAASPRVEATRHLPPTHPLSTGQHIRGQEAVPVHHDGGPTELDGWEEQGRDTRRASDPVPPSVSAFGERSRPVSAIEDEGPPPRPDQTDGAADAVQAASIEAAVAAPAAMDSAPAHITSTGEPINSTDDTILSPEEPAQDQAQPKTEPASEPQPASKPESKPESQMALPNGVATAHEHEETSPIIASPSPSHPESPSPASNIHIDDGMIPAPSPPPSSIIHFDDGMIPVLVEPPPIKAVRAAPGMSATSGPLEDFPEGGTFHG